MRESIRSDNGPEFVNRSVREFLNFIEVGASYIEPESPWQNGDVESFHSRLRDECLACEVVGNLSEARTVIGLWKDVCNYRRPHSSLGGETATNFERQFYLTLTRVTLD